MQPVNLAANSQWKSSRANQVKDYQVYIIQVNNRLQSSCEFYFIFQGKYFSLMGYVYHLIRSQIHIKLLMISVDFILRGFAAGLLYKENSFECLIGKRLSLKSKKFMTVWMLNN